MAMRSSKDLKQIVTGVRAQSKGNGIAGKNGADQPPFANNLGLKPLKKQGSMVGKG